MVADSMPIAPPALSPLHWLVAGVCFAIGADQVANPGHYGALLPLADAEALGWARCGGVLALIGAGALLTPLGRWAGYLLIALLIAWLPGQLDLASGRVVLVGTPGWLADGQLVLTPLLAWGLRLTAFRAAPSAPAPVTITTAGDAGVVGTVAGTPAPGNFTRSAAAATFSGPSLMPAPDPVSAPALEISVTVPPLPGAAPATTTRPGIGTVPRASPPPVVINPDDPWIDGVLRGIARATGASDVVLEPLDNGFLAVRARIAGVYSEIDRCGPEVAARAVARLKSLASVPAYINDKPQDGRIDGIHFGLPGDLRAAFMPTVRGPRAALRLPALGTLPAPAGLGLPDNLITGLRATMRLPAGLLLVCGPTGSGKTTTIHSLISDLAADRPDRQVLAIEDPVERRLAGVVQIEVRPQFGFTFADALKAALRQDPDVMVIGEIRDTETAQAVVRAALTGHLVVTTLHCGRAAEAMARLVEMGVQPELLLPTLRGVLAQRLVRVVHDACNGNGCADCHGGFSGRRVVADWTMPDHDARAAWLKGTPPPLLADLDHQAAGLVLAGITTPGEVRRAIGSRT